MKKGMRAALIIGAIFLTGCTTIQYPTSMTSWGERNEGIYHVVKRGETLWSISQIYKVDVREIAWANRIKNSAVIKRGQRIFVPGASAVVGVNASVKDLDSKKFEWPLRGKFLSYFQGRGTDFWKHGIRVQASAGQSIVAARAGEVVFSDVLMGYGYTVIVDHQDGYLSVYANNGQSKVGLGRDVKKGDTVAQMPLNEGRFLYFEIRRKGVAENPLFYLPKI